MADVIIRFDSYLVLALEISDCKGYSWVVKSLCIIFGLGDADTYDIRCEDINVVFLNYFRSKLSGL